jgi:hypothetical protein
VKGGSAPDRKDATTVGGLLRFQGVACEYLGSPLYADLLRRAAEDYERGGPARRVLEGHEQDPQDSALALRLMGAVHRLVLEGEVPGLADRYGAADGDRDRTWATFRAVLEDRVGELRRLVRRPVQTNEVGRCAALLPGFLGVAERFGLPLRMLEVGASAGLNLRWSAYRYEAGDFAWGPADSPMRIAFELEGGEIPVVAAEVAERAGCDASPVDPASEEGRLTLLSYVWPDQAIRMERMRAALELSAGRAAAVEQGTAVEWTAAQLAEPARGLATIVYHSVVMQYLSAQERRAFERVVAEAGSRATADAPLAWLRMEPDGERAAIQITTWPGEEERLLARAGYHGTPVELCEPGR